METQKETPKRLVNCDELKHGILGDGEPLDPTKAGGYIKNYLQGVGDGPGASHNFGYLFGFDNVTTFFNDILAYNDDDDNPTKVEGVRVYIGRQNPVNPGDPAVPGDKVMDTVFLIPVLSNGDDLPVLNHLEGDTIILGNPRPCPNECLREVSFLKDLKK